MNEMPSPSPNRPKRRSKAVEICGNLFDAGKHIIRKTKKNISETIAITREKTLKSLGWFGETLPVSGTKDVNVAPFEVGAIIGTCFAASSAIAELLGQGIVEGDLSKYDEILREGMYFWLWTVPPSTAVIASTMFKHGETVKEKCASVLKTSIRSSTGAAIPIWIGYTATSINQIFS